MALLNLNIFENALNPTGASSIKSNNTNNNRWLTIKYFLPNEDCGNNSNGNECQLNKTRLRENKFFIIKKFSKDNPAELEIIKKIKNGVISQDLLFDTNGNIGILTGLAVGTMSNDEIIYKNPIIISNEEPTRENAEAFPRNATPFRLNDNGKFIMSNQLNYILYNDAESKLDNFNLENGNYYLLYNPLHREHFNIVYNLNVSGNTESRFGATPALNNYFTNYCYSTITPGTNSNSQAVDNQGIPFNYYGDNSCNCFSAPTPTWGIERGSSNNDGTTPLLYSNLTNNNQATWEKGLTPEFSRSLNLTGNLRPIVCLNTFCETNNNNSFLSNFVKQNNGGTNCADGNFELHQNICQTTINVGAGGQVSNNQMINECGTSQACINDCAACGMATARDGSCYVRDEPPTGKPAPPPDIFYAKCLIDGDNPDNRTFTGECEQSSEKMDDFEVSGDIQTVRRHCETCKSRKNTKLNFFGFDELTAMCIENPDKNKIKDGRLFKTKNECLRKMGKIDEYNGKEKNEDYIIIIMIIVGVVLLISIGAGSYFYFSN